jgi:outer membrane receptor for ferrienterochelin and colicins
VRLLDDTNDEPIERALVVLYGNDDTLTAVSGKDGIAYFSKVAPGSLRVSHLSYHSTSRQVSTSTQMLVLRMQQNQEDLDEVVVTGLIAPTSQKKAIKPIRVISSQRIQNQAAVNLKDLLSNELNFRISEDPILGSQLNLQGLSGQKIKILVDGVPVIGRLDGNIDISQINLNNIERVEVVEGPMAVEFGSDAIAGTINLITKKKFTQSFNTSLNSYYESVGRYNADANIRFNLFNTQTSLSFGRNFFDGFSPNPSLRSSSWNPKEQYFTTLNLQKRFGKVLLRWNSDYFNEQVINLGDVNYNSPFRTEAPDSGIIVYPAALDDYYRTTRFNNSIYSDYYYNTNTKIKAYIAYNFYQRRKNSLLKNLGTGEESFLEDPSTQDTTRFDLVNSRIIFSDVIQPKKLSYQIGTEFTFESSEGKRIENSYQDVTDFAVFTSFDYQLSNRISLKPGLRYAYNNRFNTPLIGSLAARYQPLEKIILRASYGKGFRAPTLKELYFDFVDENHNVLGNTDLKAENSDQYQFSAQFTHPFNKESSLEINSSYYYNNIYDEIRLVSVVDPSDSDPRGEFRNINIGRTQTQGINLNSVVRVQSLTLNTGYTYAGELNSVAISNTISGFNFFSQARFNVSYQHQPWGLTASFFTLFTGKRNQLVEVGSELITTTFDAFSMSDISLVKSLWQKKITLSTGVKNVLDIQNIGTSNFAGGGIHSSGNGSLPIGYGRTFFIRFQLAL